jgi:hypothetical protein
MGDRNIAPSGPRLGSLANRPAFVTFPLSPIGRIQISQERVAATKRCSDEWLCQGKDLDGSIPSAHLNISNRYCVTNVRPRGNERRTTDQTARLVLLI